MAAFTVAEERAIRLKFDLTIVPMVTILYMCCAIDRANIGNARIEGMAEDLDLIGYRYNIVLSIFFIIYMSVEVPSNVILKRVGPRYYIPGLVFCFGLVSLCTAFVQSYAGLAVSRAILGIFEGGAMPATAFFLSCYFRKAELFFRMSIFIASSALASSFGGLLAVALSHIPAWGASSTIIERWRNIFFMEGLVTMLIAIASSFFMPQTPGTWKYLTLRQRHIAAARIQQEINTNPQEKVTWRHVRQGIFNIHTNVCAWCFFCTNSAVQGMGAFIPTILKQFGWTSTEAQLYSVPPYVVACAFTIALGYVSDKTNRRGIFMLGALVFSITGYGILRFSEEIHAKYTAVFLAAMGIFAASSGFISWGINNTGHPAVAAVVGGYIVSIGSIGGVLSTWTYLSTDSPNFHIGHTINFSLQLFCFCLTAFGIAHCYFENKMRDAGKRDIHFQGLPQEEVRQLGHKSPTFRYML
ncbi:major facilitator superfamily domain-containing protein [Talaromyces proteolyticus]|uniref:Major facilitator superfamily domain-containing protein n=1 Tax=Talaromyces proteolyticus TaxID=1131652 RepID=A0AAD4KH32_9EURO|nr:major facilitator superfamily domain-containing protein [Talaromyces proteolyticus]KAH8689334.1 major facilitator superfamily domain-containing protein [Talaromyces proteolyticus]